MNIAKSVGTFMFHTFVTACVIYMLIDAANAILGPTKGFDLAFAFFRFIMSASIVYIGVNTGLNGFFDTVQKR